MAVQTTAVMIQSLCVPCRNRCRYCLLSWDGRTEGAPWDRSVQLARRFREELRLQRPGISTYFTFGYSMEHPDLREALRTLRSLGSPMAEFLQCDGMKMRSEEECAGLMTLLREEGVRELNFTVYGPPAYHDAFAGRKGDHALLLRMMRAAKREGIPFDTGIPLTRENIGRTEETVRTLRDLGSRTIRLFLPHGEGRGRSLDPVRLRAGDLDLLSPEDRSLLDRTVYRTEADWLKDPEPVRESRRTILISLRPEHLEEWEGRSALSIVEELEALDEAYYAAFPDFRTLGKACGDPEGDRLYRIRDLYAHYRALYAGDHPMEVYDVTDERYSGSRRV